MRLASLLTVLLVVFTNRVIGQELDIGGIELRLGQRIEDALKALAPYQVRYNDDSKGWFITQRGRAPFELLGTLSATDRKVSAISKAYALSSPYESQRVYTQASRDVRRKGGPICTTRNVEYTDKTIREIETRCGEYRLVYTLPSTYQGDNLAAGVWIRLGGQ